MARERKIREREFPEIPEVDETFSLGIRDRIRQSDILPQQITDRLLSEGATVAHALSGASHTGTLSNTQHGSLTGITNAHPWSDLNLSSSDISDLGGTIVTAQLAAEHRRHTMNFSKDSDDAAAATTTSETIIFEAPDAITLTAASYLPSAALTANDTNYATIAVYRRNGSTGGSQVSVVSQTTETTGSGNWTAFKAVDLGSLSTTALADGQVITFEITKSGSGVVVPRGILHVEYTVD